MSSDEVGVTGQFVKPREISSSPGTPHLGERMRGY